MCNELCRDNIEFGERNPKCCGILEGILGFICLIVGLFFGTSKNSGVSGQIIGCIIAVFGGLLLIFSCYHFKKHQKDNNHNYYQHLKCKALKVCYDIFSLEPGDFTTLRKYAII